MTRRRHLPSLVLIAATLLSPQVVAQSATIVEAATYGTKVAPGGIISIFGSGFTSNAEVAGTIPLPRRLAGVSVQANGIAFPLFYAGPNQIKAQLPFEFAPGSLNVMIQRADGGVTTTVANIAAAAPGVFTEDSSGRDRAFVFKPDFSGRYSLTPVPVGTDRAVPGQPVVLYLTGLGKPINGNSATGDKPNGLQNVVRPTITLGGKPAEILFAGLAPGLVGLNQVNIVIPEGVTGRVPLEVCSSGNCVAAPLSVETNCADHQLAAPLGSSITVGGIAAPQWLGDPRPQVVTSPKHRIPIQTNGYHLPDIDCKYRVRLEWIDRAWDNAIRSLTEGLPGVSAPKVDQIVNKVTTMSTFGYAGNSVDQGAAYYRSAIRTCSAGEKVAGRGGQCVDDISYYRSPNNEFHLCQTGIALEMAKGIGQAIGLTQRVPITQLSGAVAMVPCYSVLADYVGWDCRPNDQTQKPVNLGAVCSN